MTFPHTCASQQCGFRQDEKYNVVVIIFRQLNEDVPAILLSQFDFKAHNSRREISPVKIDSISRQQQQEGWLATYAFPPR